MKNDSKNISMLAYEVIKKKILQNELNSKRSLNEKIFSQDLKFSRTPIREAFIMLEKEDLLTRYEGRGFFVKQFSVKDIDDIYEFRLLVEIAAADIILSRVTDDNIDELYDILEEVEGIIKKGNPADALVKAIEFHVKTIEISNNEMIIKALKNCYDKLILISWSCQNIEASIKSAKEHEAILSALRERDSEKFKMNIRNHIISAKDRVINFLRVDTGKLYFLP